MTDLSASSRAGEERTKITGGWDQSVSFWWTEKLVLALDKEQIVLFTKCQQQDFRERLRQNWGELLHSTTIGSIQNLKLKKKAWSLKPHKKVNCLPEAFVINSVS